MLNSTQIIGKSEEYYTRERSHVINDLYPDESLESKIWRAYFNGWVAGRIDLAHEYNITDKLGEI
jgi:hypothetical protein